MYLNEYKLFETLSCFLLCFYPIIVMLIADGLPRLPTNESLMNQERINLRWIVVENGIIVPSFVFFFQWIRIKKNFYSWFSQIYNQTMMISSIFTTHTHTNRWWWWWIISIVLRSSPFKNALLFWSALSSVM